ncbi:MAG TPA: cell division protein FtsA [Longilinea sp.]|nr:cell division protein FtsA [Longilinea sp.]
MDEPIVVGIDVGTTKICTLVARVEGEHNLRVLGVGIEPSAGIRRGNVVDLAAASQAISRSVEKAQRSSGLEIASALVSLAGSQIASVNSRGVVGITGGVVTQEDISRALEAAQAVAIPHNREILHVIQRGFTIDGQDEIQTPIGMHGYRLEVEANIITAGSTQIENLRQCVEASGVEAVQFVLNPLASAEVVLNDNERSMGAAVCDIGGGTTDLAIYIDGNVWHTAVLPVGGNHITNDVAAGLRLPPSQAEEIKKEYGHSIESEVADGDTFTVRGFGDDQPLQISRKELAHIIEARVEEMFVMVLQEIKRSGYDGLLPAGMILTGGSSLLPGMRNLASQVTGLPVRVARPENLIGLVDQLHSPAYSTSIGLLYWALMMSDTTDQLSSGGSRRKSHHEPSQWLEKLKEILRNILP